MRGVKEWDIRDIRVIRVVTVGESAGLIGVGHSDLEAVL